MTALAAIATFLLLALPALGAWSVARPRVDDPRLALGWVALGWAAWAMLVSELLSLGAPHVVGEAPGHLTRWWLVGAWAVPGAASLVLLVRTRGVGARRALLDLRAAMQRPSMDTVAVSRASTMLDLSARWVIAACLTLTALVALLAAPNNWDSMVYHLARVAVWERLGGIVHYATNVEPQLYQPPGAETLIAQTFLIAGTDALAALVQWMAYVGVVAVAGAAAALLGADRRTQLLAHVLAATAPLAILEASSTQNDLVLSFWLLLAATWATGIWTRASTWSARTHVAAALGASAALGMAAATKGTGLLYGLPIGILLLAACLRRVGARRALPLAVVGALVLALPNLGGWSRTNDTFGSPLAAGDVGLPYRVEHPTPRTAASNLVRNVSNHLDLPIAAWNRGVEHAVERTHDALGIDEDDPRTTFVASPFRVGPYGPHEDHAGSFVLLVLGLAALVVAIVDRVRRRAGSGARAGWLGMLLAQIVLFDLLLTWQNWHVRLHLPVTLAAIPLLAAVLGAPRTSRVPARLLLIGALVSTLLAPVYLFGNVTRPLVGEDSVLTHSRTHTRFVPRPRLRTALQSAVRQIHDAGVTEAGIAAGIDDWVYALTVLGDRVEPSIRFHEVLVTNGTATWMRADGAFGDAVVCLSCRPEQAAALEAAGLTDVPLTDGDATGTHLFLRAPRP